MVDTPLAGIHPFIVYGRSALRTRTIAGLIPILLFTLLSGSQVTLPQDGESFSAVPTNLQIMRNLAGGIGAKIVLGLDRNVPDRLNVRIVPHETAWLIEAPLLSALTAARGIILTSENPSHSAELGIGDLRVTYDDARKSGFIGSTIVDRQVLIDLSVHVTDNRSGEVIMARTFQQSYRDTIELSSIGSVENPNIPATRGELPSEGFFTNVAEPLIVLGALAVAVFLLFHVRS